MCSKLSVRCKCILRQRLQTDSEHYTDWIDECGVVKSLSVCRLAINAQWSTGRYNIMCETKLLKCYLHTFNVGNNNCHVDISVLSIQWSTNTTCKLYVYKMLPTHTLSIKCCINIRIIAIVHFQLRIGRFQWRYFRVKIHVFSRK